MRPLFGSFTIASLRVLPSRTVHLSSDRDFDLDTSLDVDDDLLDDLGRGVETIWY